MKKILAVSIIIAIIVAGILLSVRIAEAVAPRNEVTTSGTYVNVDILTKNLVKRFVDGKNTCYLAQVGSQLSISCIKN